ncbi:protease-4 [Elusimicrobium simillimum]|uniref:signal peptide peptidase SppA n=1 Tax=Elusimicrobium simillimum TaxID=3143438 RepID=UPI003C6EC2F9
MGTETENINQEIFETNPNPGEQPQEQTATPPQEPAPVLPQPEQPKAKKLSMRGTNWLSVFVLLFFVSSLSGLYIIFSGGVQGGKKAKVQKTAQLPAFSNMAATAKKNEPGVAVIKIKGAIMESSSSSWRDTSASAIAKRIRDTADKDNVKAIIIDINSPGGTVAAVQDIYNAILYARNKKGKKVVALFRDVAASGGFYIAMAADKIVAQPGTITGSIGVIMQTSNFEGLMGKVGVQFSSIKSGQHKDIGSPYRPMTQEERTLVQEMIDDSYNQFLDAVKQGRPNINPMELKVYADGRVFTGRKAFSIGLIDALGGESEALDIVRDLAGNKSLKILSNKPDTFREWFFSFDPEMSSRDLTRQLESMASPKMAYLWTM